jgi:hypothetical protein
MSTQQDALRELLDDDGENQAVRAFLQLYGTANSVTVQHMRDHLRRSGWDGFCPEWAAAPNTDHLTKSGAQDWLRHLFELEAALASQPAAAPAGQGEREQFEAWMYGPCETTPKNSLDLAWQAWQARAALAQPVPATDQERQIAELRAALQGAMGLLEGKKPAKIISEQGTPVGVSHVNKRLTISADDDYRNHRFAHCWIWMTFNPFEYDAHGCVIGLNPEGKAVFGNGSPLGPLCFVDCRTYVSNTGNQEGAA